MSLRYGEVVELVYGTSLENWRRFVAYRGFESHPLRHLNKKPGLLIFFIINKTQKTESIWRFTQVVEGDGLLNRQGFVRGREGSNPSISAKRKNFFRFFLFWFLKKKRSKKIKINVLKQYVNNPWKVQNFKKNKVWKK